MIRNEGKNDSECGDDAAKDTSLSSANKGCHIDRNWAWSGLGNRNKIKK